MKSAIDPQAPVLQISIPSDSAANRGALLSSGSGQSGKGRMQFTGQPLVIPTCSVTSTNYTPISMPQSSACFTTADPDPIPHKSSKTTKEAIDILLLLLFMSVDSLMSISPTWQGLRKLSPLQVFKNGLFKRGDIKKGKSLRLSLKSG